MKTVNNVAFSTASEAATLKELSEGIEGDIETYYYCPVKPEEVSAKKKVLLREKATGVVGELLATELAKFGVKIPGKVKPDSVPGFDVFIQSTSHNRKIAVGQKVAFQGEGVSQGDHDEEDEDGDVKRGRLDYSLFDEIREEAAHVGPSFAERFGGVPADSGPILLKWYQNRMESDLGLHPILEPRLSREEEEEDENDEGDDPHHYLNSRVDADPNNLGTSKFGGQPHLPDELAYLEARVGHEKSRFVAQLDLSFISKYDVLGVLPKEGWIWVWHKMDDDPVPPTVVYWNGPREKLKIRYWKQFWKPVRCLFIRGFYDRLPDFHGRPEECPIIFGRQVLDEGEEISVFESFDRPARAAVTLLCIKEYCTGTIFDKVPRDVVRMIAKKVFDSRDDYKIWHPNGWRSDPNHDEDKDALFALFAMGSGGDCVVNPGACYYFSPLIPFEDLKKRYWGKFICISNQD